MKNIQIAAWILMTAVVTGLAVPAMAQDALTAAETQALRKAIDDEYQARALYANVIEDFGEVRPFSNIIRGEENHIAALTNLFTRYGMDVPKDRSAEKAPHFDSLEAARAQAVKFEEENADLYERLAKNVAREDILAVFSALGYASKMHHLPALKGERCGGTENGQGNCGQGQGQGQCAKKGKGNCGQGQGQGQCVKKGKGNCGQGQGQGQGAMNGMGNCGQGQGQGQGAMNGMGRGHQGNGPAMMRGMGHGQMGHGMMRGQGQGRGYMGGRH